MSLFRNVATGLRSLFRKQQVDRELDEELGAYLEMAAAAGLYAILAKPLADVVELTLIFPGPSMIEVAELEVMGKPSQPVEGIGDGPKLAERD